MTEKLNESAGGTSRMAETAMPQKSLFNGLPRACHDYRPDAANPHADSTQTEPYSVASGLWIEDLRRGEPPARPRPHDNRPSIRGEKETAMPKWSGKDERQYEKIKESSLTRGVKEPRSKEPAARTVNKRRRQEGRTKSK